MSQNQKHDVNLHTLIYPEYVEAMQLIDPDAMKIFRAELRSFKTALARSVFEPTNKTVFRPWSDPKTQHWKKPIHQKDKDGNLRYRDKVDEDTGEVELDDKGNAVQEKVMKDKKIKRVHQLNQISMSYLQMVKMHLVRYGDQAVANIGSMLTTIPEAVSGIASNLKSSGLIVEPGNPNDGKIVLKGRDVQQLSKAMYDFDIVAWEAWEKLWADPNAEITFNTKDTISISRVVETQVRTYLGAIYDAFYAHYIWKSYKMVQDIMAQAKIAQEQMNEEFKGGLKENLQFLKDYRVEYAGELSRMSAATKDAINNAMEYNDQMESIADTLDENGVIQILAESLRNMAGELARVEEHIKVGVEVIDDVRRKAKGETTRLSTKVNEIKKLFGDDKMKYIMDKYGSIEDDIIAIASDVADPTNGKSGGILNKLKRN